MSVKEVERKVKEIKQSREVTKDNDMELSSDDKEVLETINDFEDFMENADVEEIC
ncbi:MAG: hypothetical protein ACI4WH_05885 [Oscillospiraceae bacterium]